MKDIFLSKNKYNFHSQHLVMKETYPVGAMLDTCGIPWVCEYECPMIGRINDVDPPFLAKPELARVILIHIQ